MPRRRLKLLEDRVISQVEVNKMNDPLNQMAKQKSVDEQMNPIEALQMKLRELEANPDSDPKIVTLIKDRLRELLYEQNPKMALADRMAPQRQMMNAANGRTRQ